VSEDPAEYRYRRAISASGKSIYDPIEVGDPSLWVPSEALEGLLDKALKGVSLAGLPIRTRSKVVKTAVCKALGYPVPASFAKTRPRFPGQHFDTYVQKSNNLQVWNEELAADRRYVLIRTSADDVITRVKVVTGADLAPLDTTGTLTQKYQARCEPGSRPTQLVTEADTDRVTPLVNSRSTLRASPISYPAAGELLPIKTLFERLSSLVGEAFDDAGYDQERNRGAALHRLACKALGYSTYQDDGRFPDIRHQLLEVKLQTSPTIDLGLVRPDSTGALDTPKAAGRQLRHCDVRYAVFCGNTQKGRVRITHVIVTTGEAFFKRFPQFQGAVLNKKLQIPLPAGFFSR